MDPKTNFFGQTLPQRLYHYTDSSGLLGIFSSQNIWASRIDCLNDTEEYKSGKSVVEKVVKKIRRRKNTGDFFQELDSWWDFTGANEPFVASFCEEGDLLSQWRGYAGGHGGYSIGIDPRYSLDYHSSRPAKVLDLVRCLYDEDALDCLITSVINYFLHQWMANFAEDADKKTGSEPMQCGLLLPVLAASLKNKSFEEEKEWRIINLSRDLKMLRFRSGPSFLIPYVEIPLGEAELSNLGIIKEVVVGPRPNPKLAETTLKKFIECSVEGCPSIRQSSVPFRNW